MLKFLGFHTATDLTITAADNPSEAQPRRSMSLKFAAALGAAMAIACGSNAAQAARLISSEIPVTGIDTLGVFGEGAGSSLYSRYVYFQVRYFEGDVVSSPCYDEGELGGCNAVTKIISARVGLAVDTDRGFVVPHWIDIKPTEGGVFSQYNDYIIDSSSYYASGLDSGVYIGDYGRYFGDLIRPSTTELRTWSSSVFVKGQGIALAKGPYDHIFTRISAVPEPATWGMMIVGFGLAGAALRRKVRLSQLA